MTGPRKPCPNCGAPGSLTLDQVLVGNSDCAWSLAGVQTKALAHGAFRLACDACSWSILGDVEDVELDADGVTIIGGTFIARPEALG